jgi:hypothetical protein
MIIIVAPNRQLLPTRKNRPAAAAEPTQANRPRSRAGRCDRSAMAPTMMSSSADMMVAAVTVYGAIDPGSRGAVSTTTTAATASGTTRAVGRTSTRVSRA